ncbi:SSI family serine proteinase inhibitor [Allokutzneria sp. NRRL B-24872]|uniref:SSI family serine proteinase inhibitor n=1 Tax=Allokutzneria sp. NRRL B-24872 TaxID=1137961 RepID=UPI000A36C1CD|nr:SSI family serine proteinase inhibitor [Allokutzneria sp. NRRL B-24872]
MRLAKAVLAGVLLAGVCTAPAMAAGSSGVRGAGPIALVLTVASGERALPAGHTALLACEPLGGTHSRTHQACDRLREVYGDIARLSHREGPCTDEYSPVTATAYGTYRGNAVSYTRTWPNRCEMWRATGELFQFETGVGRPGLPG